VNGGRLKIGIKVGSSFFEDIVVVEIGIDGATTNENIARGLEALAREIRKQTAFIALPRGDASGEDPDLRAEGGL
jgi:hypothetical protein